MHPRPKTVQVGTRPRTRLSACAAALMTLGAAFLLVGCLGPDDVDPTGNAPFGRIDSAVAAGTSIRIQGWAIDPNTTAPVHVSVSHLSIGTKHLANAPRPDVARVHPKYGANHGFDITTPSGGRNGELGQVCLWVENVGSGTEDRILGCREVKLRSDDATGRFENATAINANRIRISGWALDPETSNPVSIRYSVDGNPAVTVRANIARADINRNVRIEGDHGFSIDLSVAVGSHKVCIEVIGVGRGTNADLGCKTVVTESVTPLGPGADLTSVTAVGPPPGHPLEQADRDAGVSTVLSDGSVLWLFGDTSGWNPDGTIKYFINNTAAWAPPPPGKPTVTTDAVAPGSEPYQFVFPTTPFTTACPARWKSVMWPLSATTVPVSSTKDRVVAFMGNVCTGSGEWQMQSRGVSVVDWEYDRAAPPSAKKIEARVLAQNLFPAGLEYGTSAHFDGEYIKAYQCGRPADDGQLYWPNDPGFGPCTLARVLPEKVQDPADWSYWTGFGWSPFPVQAKAMELPGLPDENEIPGDKQLPVAAFSIHKDQHRPGEYLMVYSPWPGITPEVAVRRAPSENGPWSKPTSYSLPGCYDSAKGGARHCYAAIAQPALSTATSIGIGYFDQLIALGPARGGYLAGAVQRRS